MDSGKTEEHTIRIYGEEFVRDGKENLEEECTKEKLVGTSNVGFDPVSAVISMVMIIHLIHMH